MTSDRKHQSESSKHGHQVVHRIRRVGGGKERGGEINWSKIMSKLSYLQVPAGVGAVGHGKRDNLFGPTGVNRHNVGLQEPVSMR